MKEYELKKLVEYYEERILTKFDYHFNKLVLEDFYEGGYEMRIEDEWFYDEYFDKYEKGIVNLLSEIEDEKYYDYKLRLIRLKRHIDSTLIKIGKEDNNGKPIRQMRINHFILLHKINKESFILKLHSELTSHNFIQCDINNFKQLFSKNTDIDKIKWKGIELQITYFVNALMSFLDKEVNNNKYKLVETYFINKSGNNFKAKQLGSVFAEKKENIPNDDAIIKVFKEMSAHF